MTGSRRAFVVLAVVALTLAVVVGVLTHRLAVAQRTADAERAAVAAATELTPVLLGYGWRTIDDDAGRIDAATVGPFADQNRAIVAGLVVPAALEQRASSAATVERVAVVTSAPDRVETLVLYVQSTRREGEPAATRDPRAARVTLAPGPDDGRWLVAGFDAL